MDQQPPTLPITKKTAISGLGILFILFSGLATTNILLEQKQDIRKKAAELTTKNTQEEKEAKLQTYNSDELGLTITFDTTYWTPTEDLSQQNLKELNFSLQKEGPATIKLTTQPLPSPETTLETLANTIQQESTNLINKEKTDRNNKPYYKFTLKETYLGSPTQYYQYITIANNNHYTIIEAKYPQIEPTATLAENFIDSISFNTRQTPNTKGASTIQDGLVESQIADLAKPSVVSIIHIYCQQITTNQQVKTKFLKPEYTICGNSKGSGFIINENGYIATNGHVVKSFPEETLIQTIQKGQDELSIHLIQEIFLLQRNQSTSTQQAQSILTDAKSNPLLLDSLIKATYQLLNQKTISATQKGTRYLVNLGNEPVTLDYGKLIRARAVDTSLDQLPKTIKEAELIDYNYPNKYSPAITLQNNSNSTSDVAILKIKETHNLSFPSLKLGNTQRTKEGLPVLVIGYPSLVEGSPSSNSLISFASSQKPTVTRGIVSAIKTDQAGNKLIQTDTSIERGNSGGPAFDKNAQVIGIATYGFTSGSGNYNFLRDIEDLTKLITKHNIEINESDSYLAWSQGLEYYWIAQYKKAIPLFQKAEKLYPLTPIFKNYTDEAQQAIKQGKNRGSLPISFSSIPPSAIIFLILAGITGGVTLSLLFLPKRLFLNKS